MFTAAQEAIEGVKWDELGQQVADGLGRAFGIVSGVGDVALGLGEAGIAAGQQGVNALKGWIASWGTDAGVENEAAKVGKGVITDLGTGVNDAVPDLEEIGGDAADRLIKAIQSVLTEDALKAIGQKLTDDIGLGVVYGEDDLLVIVEALAGDSFDAVENAVALANFAEIGRQIDNGIKAGIDENSHFIQEAARAAANAAYTAAKLELGIASPSKKGAYLGEMFDLGFADGVVANADAVEDAMGYLNGLAVADAEPAAGGFGGTGRQSGGIEVDYAAVRDAFAEAIEQTGMGYIVVAMDAQVVGESVEPYSSRATTLRQQRSVAGRSARLVMR